MTRRSVHALAVALPLLFVGTSNATVSTWGAPGPQPILGKSRPLVSAPIGNGFFIHTWTAPSSTADGVCHLVTVDHKLAAQRPSTWPTSGGGGCSLTPSGNSPSKPRAFRFVGIHVAVKDGKRREPTWIEGELITRTPTARLVARWPGGSHVLTLRHHYFAGGSPAMFGHVPALTLAAYDKSGHVIAFWQN